MPDPLYSGRYTQGFVIVPSDTSTILGGPNQSDGKPMPYCNAIHALTAGNVTTRFKDGRGGSTVTFPVLAGQIYPYALSYVYTTTTATLMGLM